MKYDRKSMAEELMNRGRESYATKDRGGSRASSVLKPELGILTWWAGEGLHLLDIIPYMTNVAGKDDKDKRGLHPDPKVKPGKPDYRWEGYLHRFIGPADQDFVCPLTTYHVGHRLYGDCPICEKRQQMIEEGNPPGITAEEYYQKVISPLRPTRYCLYNIICYDKGEQDKGIQVWPVSHYQFEKEIQAISHKARGGGEVHFALPEKELGKTIQFTRTGTGKTNTSYSGYAFEDRDYDIDDGTLDSVYCLDEIVYVPSYAEIHDAFFASAKSEGLGRGRDSEVLNAEEPEERSSRLRREDTPEREQPKEDLGRLPQRGRRAESAQEASKVEGDCPRGHEFGVDIDQFPEDCKDCVTEKYDACGEKADEIETERRKAQSSRRPIRPAPRSEPEKETGDRTGGRRKL